ncbi:acetylserotonin O-methyltransferase [Solitalea lacus]|uniref:acetylserotonin O-methyltransferase n=1 Tax=Solitalea lacus TaxID=2911172 RepID=UPI001EDBB967|nr:acetylserotonin O-methyltransferase [Solitalea lacus]UKJ07821.1 acetylserotonin O-methyltransferase [Solitalea lacus]
MNLQSSPDPSRIMQVGMGFWASKVLLSATWFDLFTNLASGKLSAGQIKEKLDLKTTDRHIYDWLDALVSLGFLQREGIYDNAFYSNAPDTDLFLDKNKPSYIGGILQMSNNRIYNIWSNLENGLKTGKPQNEAGSGNMELFHVLYEDPQKLQEFMDAMSGIQSGNFMALTNKFNFDNYRTLADIGGADAWLSIQVCLKHPNIQCVNFDLAPVGPLATAKIARFNLQDRIKHQTGDFMNDGIPSAEVITMGNILHGLDEELKQKLINKIYDKLPSNGVFIAIENIIDNDRRQNAFGLMMSLNMLLENGDGFDYTFDDFQRWTNQAGFKKVEIMPLTGPCSAAIAYK